MVIPVVPVSTGNTQTQERYPDSGYRNRKGERWRSFTRVPPISTGTSTTTPALANASALDSKTGPGSLNAPRAGSLVAPPALTFIAGAGGHKSSGKRHAASGSRPASGRKCYGLSCVRLSPPSASMPVSGEPSLASDPRDVRHGLRWWTGHRPARVNRDDSEDLGGIWERADSFAWRRISPAGVWKCQSPSRSRG